MSRGEIDDASAKRPMRCRNCYYVLTGLPENRCPECGTGFDPHDLASFTRKMPFVRWKFWLPGLLLGIGGGVVLLFLLIPIFGFGFATTLVVPFCIGGVIGYGTRVKRRIAVVLGWIAVLGCLLIVLGGTAFAQSPSDGLIGGVCFVVLLLVFIGPAIVGALIGHLIRVRLRRSNFSQRDYLDPWMLGLLLLLPVFAALIEGRHDHMPPVTIVTTADINASPWTVWRNIQFYEQVRTPPPWPLWLSPEVRPKYTTGNSAKPGDVRVCVYQHGQLKKLTRQVDAPNLLAFDVVQQQQVENRSIVLLDGAFELSPLDGGNHTRLALRTRYIPLLYPRWAYEWSERYFVHTLHRYIMNDMRLKAERVAVALSER